MPLDVAKRSRVQSTLCAIDLAQPDRDGKTLRDPGRPAMERAAPLRAFAPTVDEARSLVETVDSDEARNLVAAWLSTDPLALPAAIAKTTDLVVADVIQKLATYRQSRLDRAHSDVLSAISTAEHAWADAMTNADVEEIGSPTADAPAAARGVRDTVQLDPTHKAALGSRRRHLFLRGAHFARQSLDVRMRAVMGSAHVPDEQKEAICSAMARLGLRPDTTNFESEWETLRNHARLLEDLAGASASPAGSIVSPLGALHLERLSHIPVGLEPGEMLASQPLAPGQRLGIVRKEWANTEEEFHRVVSDRFEDYSERGVVDKTDMSEATEAQRTHSSSFSVAVTGSGGYGPMSASVATSYNASDMEHDARKAALEYSQTLTKKASARATKELRNSFRLARKTMTEDETLQWIKNPDPIHPVRYDFYRIVRKWRVDLRRCGVRLTYDLTIPQPAFDLLGVYREIWQIERELEKGFTFDLAPGGVTRTNWRVLAETYGATVEPPPPLMVSVQVAKMLGPYGDKGEHVDELRVGVPDGYSYCSHHGDGLWVWKDPQGLNLPLIIKELHTGTTRIAEIIFAVHVYNTAEAIASVRVWFELETEAENQWRLGVYNALQEAAKKRYDERRQMLADRRARLLSDLARMDSLTLRKLEREELTKGTLRWMFGPNLEFAPPVALPFYDADGRVVSIGVQAAVLKHGRLISFLHQAIEWDNINYFLYPYFWTKADTWDERMRLRADDPIHEAFLRAGAARVVLPIRPGWERAFVAFMVSGSMEAPPPNQHPYMTIAEEIENFAKTNYPGFVPANPDEVDPDKATETAEGVLIGSWYEYTPTSGVDIRVGEASPTEGVFAPTTFQPSTSVWSKLEPLVDAVEGFFVALTQKISGGP